MTMTAEQPPAPDKSDLVKRIWATQAHLRSDPEAFTQRVSQHLTTLDDRWGRYSNKDGQVQAGMVAWNIGDVLDVIEAIIILDNLDGEEVIPTWVNQGVQPGYFVRVKGLI